MTAGRVKIFVYNRPTLVGDISLCFICGLQQQLTDAAKLVLSPIQLISVSTECASQFPDSRTTKTERFLHLKDFLKKTKITYSRTDEKKVPYTSMDRKIPKPEVRVQI